MKQARILLGITIIFIGLSALFDFPFFKILFAFLLIYIGYRVLTGHDRRWGREVTGELHENEVKQVYICSGVKQKITSKSFRRAKIVSMLGSADIDLSEVKTEHKTVPIELVAILGAVRVKLPPGWHVRSEGVGIAGGFENKTQGGDEGKVELLVKGAAILGGVEIVN